MKTNYYQHEDLIAWQKSVDFAERIYMLTEDFPKSELYGLTSQIRRASISISLNIAEGKGRFSKKEFIRYLYLSRGSLYEVSTCLQLALRLKLINQDLFESSYQESVIIHKLISGLINSIQKTLLTINH